MIFFSWEQERKKIKLTENDIKKSFSYLDQNIDYFVISELMNPIYVFKWYLTPPLH